MGKWYFSLLPFILPMCGSYLKGRDSNTTGADDAVGTIMIAITPALEGISAGDESGVRKVMLAVRNVCDSYLQQTGGQKIDANPEPKS